MARGLGSEGLLHAFLLLALLPGAFPEEAAAQLLHLPPAQARRSPCSSAAPSCSIQKFALICSVSASVPHPEPVEAPQTRGRMRALTRAGLLSTLGEGAEQCWEMHACVRAAACDLSEALGLLHAAHRCTQAYQN